MNIESGNVFNVVPEGQEQVCFSTSPDGMFENIPWASARISLPRELAVNLAVWLALIADPSGEQFNRIGKEILK